MRSHKDRANDLLAKMNLREKSAQLYSIWLTFYEDGKITAKLLGDAKTVESDVDPFEIMKDGIGQITRPMGTHPVSARACIHSLNNIQKFLKEKTRLGIPALPHEECLAGLMAKGATLFPSGINYGALWDEKLVEKIASVIGKELYSVGSRQGLAPVLDVARDARWGRTEETMGEDPYLVGCLGVAYVRGLQSPGRRILATLKHYVGHSFSEGGRNHAPVRIGEKELNDTFLLPFEMAVKLANAGSVMPAYHDIDGEPLHSSSRYINEVLRDQWGFDGIVVSDYSGIDQLYKDHKIVRNSMEASMLAIQAGVDVELPGYVCYREGIEHAINKGLLEVEELNQCVYRVLLEKLRVGLFENPYIDEGSVKLNTSAHKKIAAEAASKSIVLLKNNGILPLENISKLALIGPLIDDPLCMFGGYSFPVHLILHGLSQEGKPATTLKDIISSTFKGELLYSKGCEILRERPKDSPVFPGEVGAQGDSQKSYISYDESGFSDALETAEKSDCVVLAVGDLTGLFLTGTVGEGSDASSLKLPGVQHKLLKALVKTGKPIIVVLINGRSYSLGSSTSKISALVEAWLPGQEGATAIRDVLFGKVNPGGKLPVSVPKKAGAMPFFYNYKLKSAGTPIQPDFGAEYPFGFGLSYTEFKFDNFVLLDSVISIDSQFHISFQLSNVGKIDGDETVQLYIRDIYASLVRPVKELKGFKRISLKAGQSVKVTFTVPTDILNFTGKDNLRIVEPGDFQIYIGNSSRDIFYENQITLKGEVRTLGKNWRMQTHVSVESV